MKRHAYIVLYTVVASISVSCNKTTLKQKDDGNPGETLQKETITFADVVTNVFQSGKCLSCHDGFMADDMSTYSAIMSSPGRVVPGDPSASRLYNRLASGKMPPSGKLDEQRIAIIERWIEEGAVENAQ